MPISHVSQTYDGIIVTTDRGTMPYDAVEVLNLLDWIRPREQVFIDMVAREKKQRRLTSEEQGVAPLHEHQSHDPEPAQQDIPS